MAYLTDYDKSRCSITLDNLFCFLSASIFGSFSRNLRDKFGMFFKLLTLPCKFLTNMADEKYVLNEGIGISYPKMKFCEASSIIHEMARQSNCVTYVTKS